VLLPSHHVQYIQVCILGNLAAKNPTKVLQQVAVLPVSLAERRGSGFFVCGVTRGEGPFRACASQASGPVKVAQVRMVVATFAIIFDPRIANRSVQN
jgi:hypothetical protein